MKIGKKFIMLSILILALLLNGASDDYGVENLSNIEMR